MSSWITDGFVPPPVIREKITSAAIVGRYVRASSITATAMEELFGVTGGIYTQVKEHEGKIQQAKGGILFLDEIAHLGSGEQAMLLKVLDGAKVGKIGAREETKEKIPFRLFCATNKDLDKEVAEGRFLEDLLSRINRWSYYLSPLREREEELKNELERQIESNKTVIFGDNEKQYFLNFAMAAETEWRGNWRDFNNILIRIFTRSRITQDKKVTKEIIDREITNLRTAWSKRKKTEETTSNINKNSLNPNDYKNDIYYQRLCEKFGKEKVEQIYPADILQLLAVLRVCKGKKFASNAGEILYPNASNKSDKMKKFFEHFKDHIVLNFDLAKEIVHD